MELLYKKTDPDGTLPGASSIRWLSVDEYPIFSEHLRNTFLASSLVQLLLQQMINTGKRPASRCCPA